MPDLPELHPLEAFALGHGWGAYRAYREVFGNKTVRFLPWIIRAFHRFASLPSSHREISIDPGSLPDATLLWEKRDCIIYTFEVAFCPTDSRLAYVQSTDLIGSLPRILVGKAEPQNAKYIFNDDITSLRIQLLDYFTLCADIRPTDYLFFHRNIHDVIDDISNPFNSDTYGSPADLSEDGTSIDKAVASLIRHDDSLKNAFLLGRTFSRVDLISKGFEEELRQFCHGDAPSELPDRAIQRLLSEAANEVETESTLTPAAQTSPAIQPVDDLTFCSCVDESVDQLLSSPFFEGADGKLVEYLEDCREDHYFSEYAQLPIDDLIKLAKLRCRFEEAMRFTLKRIEPENKRYVESDLTSDAPRELRHKYPNSPNDFIDSHMAAGAKMMSDNALHNAELVFRHYVDGIENVIKKIFRQEWLELDRESKRQSGKPLSFSEFLRKLQYKSKDRDFLVERIATNALEIFSRHRNLGVHGSSSAMESGEDIVLWEEAVGVHHNAQALYKRIRRYLARPHLPAISPNP